MLKLIGFICSGIRLTLYPFVSYIVFRFVSGHHIEIDPWCLHHSCEITLTISGEDLPVLIINIGFTLSAYIIGWVACCMMLSKFRLFAPLIVSTPSAVILYYLFSYGLEVHSKVIRQLLPPRMNCDWNTNKKNLFLCLVCLWLCQLIAMLYFLSAKSNVLSKGSEMLGVPHHDGVFLKNTSCSAEKPRNVSFQI